MTSLLPSWPRASVLTIDTAAAETGVAILTALRPFCLPDSHVSMVRTLVSYTLGSQSGRGLPQSKTLGEFWRVGARASVLECGCALARSFHWRVKGTSGGERLGSSRGDGLGAASYWRDTLPRPSIGPRLVLYWSSIGPLLMGDFVRLIREASGLLLARDSLRHFAFQ
jgi:hypothetical protein